MHLGSTTRRILVVGNFRGSLNATVDPSTMAGGGWWNWGTLLVESKVYVWLPLPPAPRRSVRAPRCGSGTQLSPTRTAARREGRAQAPGCEPRRPGSARQNTQSWIKMSGAEGQTGRAG